MCATCTESLIVSYTFWEQVRQSDEKYDALKQSEVIDEEDVAENESEYDIMNVIEYAGNDDHKQPLSDDEAFAKYTEPLRKRPRTATKACPKESTFTGIPNLQNMALPHFTITNNSSSDNEDSDPLVMLDDLIEEISPRQRFKTVNVSAMKVEGNVENSAAELKNLEKMCHTSAKDDGKSIFKCKHCPKAFATAYHLMVHARKSHVCQHCLEAFEKPNDLYAHIKEKHNKFDCLLCGRVFRSNSNLRQHMRNMHSVFLPAHVSLLNLDDKTLSH